MYIKVYSFNVFMFCLITCSIKMVHLLCWETQGPDTPHIKLEKQNEQIHTFQHSICAFRLFVHEASGLFTLQSTVVHTHFFSSSYSSICVVFCFLAIQIILQSLQSRVFGNCSLMFDHSDSTLCFYSVPRLHLAIPGFLLD